MILTCPQCTTRYQADAAKFPPAGRAVRCAKCSHTWHQSHPDSELEMAEAVPAASVASSGASVAVASEPQPQPVSAPVSEPEPKPQGLAGNDDELPSNDDDFSDAPATVRSEPIVGARGTRSTISSTGIDGRSPARHLAAIGGWTLLVLLVLVIGWSAVNYRRDVATIFPQSASLYAAFGLDVNVRGIAFDDVTYHKGMEDGSPVLTVTGQLVNISSRELPVPQIRIALTDNDRRELFSWTYIPNVATLKPGQVAPFRTRLASPPDGARHLELRFVKAGE